jgi:ABC-type sugar transport system permease subunit
LTDARYAYLLLIPLIIFQLALVIYPIGYSIWLSVHNINFAIGQVDFVGFDNYYRAVTSPDVVLSFTLTLRFVAEVVVMTVLLALGMAIVLNESFHGRWFVRVVALLPWSMAGYATAVVWRYMLSDQFGFINAFLMYLGAIDSYVGWLTSENAIEWVAIAYTWNIAPLSAFFILAGLQVIPQDLYNQARVDGLGPLSRFRFVVLPFIRYSLFIVIVLNTLLAATLVDVIIVMTGGGPGLGSNTMAFQVYKVMFKNLDLGLSAAISWLLIAFALAMAGVYFLLLMRRRGP